MVSKELAASGVILAGSKGLFPCCPAPVVLHTHPCKPGTVAPQQLSVAPCFVKTGKAKHGEAAPQHQGSNAPQIHRELKAAELVSPSPCNSGPCATGEAVVPQHHIDFDLILEKVKDLNLLAGEGISHIEHTPGGARLRQREPLPLTLYQNGIVMFNRAFRPYEDPSTQVWKGS